MMPCLEPVMMIEDGDEEDWTSGRKVEMPFMTPKRLTSMICAVRGVNYVHGSCAVGLFPSEWENKWRGRRGKR